MPLVYDTISANGKGSSRDCIAEMFNTWIIQAGIKNYKGVGDIRKTSSTQLGEHETYGHYAQYFLCQSPKGVTDRFYMVPNETTFAKALAWLGKQYGL